MVSAGYGTETPQGVTPAMELDALRAQHDRLMAETGKLRLELVEMLRRDCARLQQESQDMLGLMQFIRDQQPANTSEGQMLDLATRAGFEQAKTAWRVANGLPTDRAAGG